MPIYNLTIKAGNISKSFNQVGNSPQEALEKVKVIARLDPQFRNARVEFPELSDVLTVTLNDDPATQAVYLGPTGLGQTSGTPFDPDVAFRSLVQEEQPFSTAMTATDAELDQIRKLLGTIDEGDGEQTSIENLFTREPGSVADIALASVFDPDKGGVGGENFEVQPPEGYVPPSRIPDPLQLQGYANTGLQDILNIFYANPDRYISEIPIFEDVFNEAGQVIGQRQVGTQQVLSPVAQAALQAFSTQRGAESADIASRFGTATPFGAIAGLGGTAEQAVGLAELQARAGVTNPYAALGTGSGIGDISQILRGGLTAQERLSEQRLAALSPLLQASPGTLGGLSRVLGGEEQLRGLFSPFGVGQSSPVQGAPIQVSQQASAPSLSSLSQQVSEGPFATQAPRQTVGGYQRADLFERGGIEAEAGMTGEELGRYLGQVTPFGGGSPRGSLGAQLV
jgi:hypothetical protein